MRGDEVLIVYPKDGWILQKMAEEILSRLPYAKGVDFTVDGLYEPGGILDSGPQTINYYINYGLFRRKTSKKDIALFTHPEPDGLFWSVAERVDHAICMCEKYQHQMLDKNISASMVVPGVDQAFYPRLRLGFVGRLYTNGRKGDALLHRVKELDFVDLQISGGNIPPEELPEFYRSVDYVLVTSLYEGGPMCLLEGLASGKRVICPLDVGLARQYQKGVVPYENGSWESLLKTLSELHQSQFDIAQLLHSRSWDDWAVDHRNIFKNQIESPLELTGSRSINEYAKKNNISEIKLHLGCGGQNFSGWINIDNFDYEDGDSSRTGSAYDIKMDIRNLDVAPNTVSAILLVHVIEHFTRWDAVEMLRHYFEILAPGGSLIMEHPDLDECINFYLNGKLTNPTPLGDLNIGFTQFYGNQWDGLDYETHRYVWTKPEILNVLTSLGYEVPVLDNDAQFHVKGRDMRVVAIKPKT